MFAVPWFLVDACGKHEDTNNLQPRSNGTHAWFQRAMYGGLGAIAALPGSMGTPCTVLLVAVCSARHVACRRISGRLCLPLFIHARPAPGQLNRRALALNVHTPPLTGQGWPGGIARLGYNSRLGQPLR